MARWLHVNAGYWPLIGGAETYVQAMSERFAQDGDAVVVATTNAESLEYLWDPHQARTATGPDRLNGVQIVRSGVSHLLGSPYPFLALRRLGGMAYGWDACAPALAALSRFMPWTPQMSAALEAYGRGTQLVHGVNISLEGPVFHAFRFARRHRLPFVVTPFVHVGHTREVERYYTLPHHRRLMRASDAVMVQTRREGALLARLGVPPDRLHQVGMGVDLRALAGGSAQRFRERYRPRGPLVTFMGAITYDKGAIHLVQAMAELWRRDHPATLVLAGRAIAAGGFERHYAQLAAETQRRIVRLGQVTGELKQDLLAATDVLVMPSRVDAFGIVFLEAWAYGIPVIGGRAGGIPDVIEDGVDGLLVDFGDVRTLADAISSLLADLPRARAIGARGRAKVAARYTWDEIYARVRRVYEALAPRPSAA